MRIGIDAVALVRPDGMETYWTELLRAMIALASDDEFVLFAQPEVAERVGLRAPNLRIVGAPRSCLRPKLGFFVMQSWLRRAARAAAVDVLHHPAGIWASRSRSYRTVLTLHDLIPLHYLRHHSVRHAASMFRLVALQLASARRVDHVISVSDDSALQIRRFSRVPKERITVIPEAARTRPRSGEWSGVGGHLLCIGAPFPHKNQVRLIRAYLQSGVQRPLVIAGQSGWPRDHESRTRAALVAESGGRVRLAGPISDDEMAALYRDARALVFPSLAEGFGLPPLEAARLGVPTAISDLPAHREVMGDASCYFDPWSVDDIARGLRRIDADDALCRRLSDEGRRRAGLFSWRSAAQRTLQVYREASCA